MCGREHTPVKCCQSQVACFSRVDILSDVFMCIAQGICVCIAIALIAPFASARTLAQTTYTDADIYNFALNLEYLEVCFACRWLFTYCQRYLDVCAAVYKRCRHLHRWPILRMNRWLDRFPQLRVCCTCRPTSTTVLRMVPPLQATMVAQTPQAVSWETMTKLLWIWL